LALRHFACIYGDVRVTGSRLYELFVLRWITCYRVLYQYGISRKVATAGTEQESDIPVKDRKLQENSRYLAILADLPRVDGSPSSWHAGMALSSAMFDYKQAYSDHQVQPITRRNREYGHVYTRTQYKEYTS
jgi:hypothetical protein